jgi:hypothetical protein
LGCCSREYKEEEKEEEEVEKVKYLSKIYGSIS